MMTREEGERVAKLASELCEVAKRYQVDDVLGALAGTTAAMIGMHFPREKWDEELQEFSNVVRHLLDVGFKQKVLQ
jgi:hypothetical protein